MDNKHVTKTQDMIVLGSLAANIARYANRLTRAAREIHTGYVSDLANDKTTSLQGISSEQATYINDQLTAIESTITALRARHIGRLEVRETRHAIGN